MEKLDRIKRESIAREHILKGYELEDLLELKDDSGNNVYRNRDEAQLAVDDVYIGWELAERKRVPDHQFYLMTLSDQIEQLKKLADDIKKETPVDNALLLKVHGELRKTIEARNKIKSELRT